jgi:hypothetical protein
MTLRIEPQPAPESDTFGRSGFLIMATPSNCQDAPGMVMPRVTREQVWNSGDTELEVVPGIGLRGVEASAEA